MNCLRFVCVGLILPMVSLADGQRLYPDPFVRCEDPFIALRSADLTDKPDVPRDSVVIQLPAQRLLKAPVRIDLHGVNLDGYGIGNAVIEQEGETDNTCSYKYVPEYNAFLLQECVAMQGGNPSAIHTQRMELRVPGFEQLSRVTAWARFKGVQSNAGCGGRTPMNGQKFFNRPAADPDRWFVVIDEALVAPGSVVVLATQLTQAVNGELEATYSSGPLAFAIKTTATNAQLLSQDNRVRFVENQPMFRGEGIRTADSASQWALDRIDQEPTRGVAPIDHRFRWPAYDNTQRPSVFVLDTSVSAHTAFAGLALNIEDPNPALPSCAVSESGSAHGTNVASLLVGPYSSAQQSPLQVYFVKAAGRVSAFGVTICDGGGGMAVANALQRVSNLLVPGDIVNMSLGGDSLSGFIEMQVEQILKRGAVVVAAAGNESNAVNYPPGNIPDVITVGGTKIDDGRWVRTNFGPEVEVYAPAQDVLVATNTSTAATSISAGTSLATPLVAGIVFHNVATSAWPPAESLTVAQQQAQRLVVEGISHSTDLLPVLRGRPLEKSPVNGIALLAPPGVSLERLASGVGLWRGRHGGAGQYSLGRAELNVDGWPTVSSSFAPVREGDEVCPALSGFDFGTYPGDSNNRVELLVGCYDSESAYLGLYSDIEEHTGYRVESDDAPLFAATFTGQQGGNGADYGAVAAVMKRIDSGLFALNRHEAALLFMGKTTSPGTETPVSRVVLNALPNHSFRLNHVAIRCDETPSWSCTVWTTATQWSDSANDAYAITVYRSKFDEAWQSSPRVVESPVVVLQAEMTIDATCGVPGLGIGYGAHGVGVVPDDTGEGFSLVYTTSASGTMNGTCVRTGGTWIARGPSTLTPPLPTPSARRLGEGLFANSITFDRWNRTVLLGGGIEDRLWNSTPAIFSMDRALHLRNSWTPPRPANTEWLGTPLLSGYRGFFLQLNSILESSVRWFEP
ncbi:MAG: hypothetical protein DI536_00850 [Archangium gephyra]|uniref:Peptidase S8/S53 domain-containing protein n=1 Tax=Archangium gephyra TaxID=48 RepID=A0A2W5TVI0_9BACT|nr:MAG: hypothetical protein DI536_00850 [Archangium gephyra]